MIQLYDYFNDHFTGQQRTNVERKKSFTSPGTIVHVMHMRFFF